MISKAMCSVNGRKLSLPTTDYSTAAMYLLKERRYPAVPYLLSTKNDDEGNIFSRVFYWKNIGCLLILTKVWKIGEECLKNLLSPQKFALKTCHFPRNLHDFSATVGNKRSHSLLRFSFKYFWRSSDGNLKKTRKQCKGNITANGNGENVWFSLPLALWHKRTGKEEREDDPGSAIFWSSAGSPMVHLASFNPIRTKLPRC